MIFISILFPFSIPIFVQTLQANKVKVGADLLIEKYRSIIENKRIGLVCNHTSVLRDGHHLAGVLNQSSYVKLVALFGPEHGIRGDAPDGKSVQHGLHSKTQTPIYSLYGTINKPTPEMLKDIDLLLFDIQDIGARFYTYISTLSLSMEAAAEQGIPLVVLDRPNPIGGDRVEGPIREDSLKSFVGLHPITIIHGMTTGELAKMFNEEGWLKTGVKAKLSVVQMEGWKRELRYDETGLPWIKPSPNMTTMRTAVVYSGACLIEGTNVSEGRGTKHPFEYLGAPWMEGEKLAEMLNSFSLQGIKFQPIEFTPTDIERVTVDPKYEGELCRGIYLNVIDRNTFEPVRTAIYVLSSLKKLYPNDFAFRDRRFDRLAGVSWIREMVDGDASPEEIVTRWKDDLERFQTSRKKYLIY